MSVLARNLQSQTDMQLDHIETKPPGAAPPPQPRRDAPAQNSPQRVILAVLNFLDEQGIAYCVPHGWESLPEKWGSDIDVIVARGTRITDLAGLFERAAAKTGAVPVRARGGYITFACTGNDGLPCFVSFDFGHDYHAGSCFIASAETMLAGRRRFGQIWIPDAALSAAAGLLRGLLRDRLEHQALQRISARYAEAPAAARQAFGRFLSPALAAAAAAAAESGDWSAITAGAAAWRAGEARRIRRTHPGRALACWTSEQAGRLGRVIRPQGFHAVLLGPDGAGKSSTIAALETALAPLFARTEVKGFAPTLKQILRRKQSSTATPHALKPRSLPTSLLRAAWWTVFAVASHATLRWEKTRSTLVLNDRHFIDILVDPVRYRYGGPRWLLLLIARLLPKPDAVILLHGPAEILQARKKELTVEETARQCRDYLALVTRLSNAHVIDATQPFAAVVAQAAGIVLSKH